MIELKELKRPKELKETIHENHLKKPLSDLCTADYGSVLRFEESSGLYSFSEIAFRPYADNYFKDNDIDE